MRNLHMRCTQCPSTLLECNSGSSVCYGITFVLLHCYIIYFSNTVYKVQIICCSTVTQLISLASGTCRCSLRWGSSRQMLTLYQRLHTWQNKQNINHTKGCRKLENNLSMERLTLPVTLISSISDIYLLLVSDNHDHRISVQKTCDDMHVLGTLSYKFIQEGIWMCILRNPYMIIYSFNLYKNDELIILRTPATDSFNQCERYHVSLK
jgi:hypothetical protein